MTNPPSRADVVEIDPLEAILRLVAAASPLPWYPRRFAKKNDISLPDLAADVEFLWKEGYLRSESRPGDTVPGLVLTDKGKQALSHPEGLRALREGSNGSHARRGEYFGQALSPSQVARCWP